MERVLGDVTAVLMVKRPQPGEVKTRLVVGGAFGPQDAADLAWAMLSCTAYRLRLRGRLVLAVSPDGCGEGIARRLGLPGVPVLDQGPGDLGDRMDRVRRRVGESRPVAFFGADSPDLPDEALRLIPQSLRSCDVAIGPTPDGGYWTLASAVHRPEVLAGIDWGGGNVYDQTCRRAKASGLVLRELPGWHDIDRPEDVDGLRLRLQALAASQGRPLTDAILQRLAERLESLCPAHQEPS